MKSIHFGAVIIILLALVTGCGSPTPTVTPTPTTPAVITVEGQTGSKSSAQYADEECKFNNSNIPPGGSEIKCGVLTVLENRKKPDGKMIKLHVAIIKSQGTSKQADLVLLIFSSPSPILQYAPGIAYGFGNILSKRDIIVMDQRGVGASEPNLDCPEITDLFFTSLDVGPYSKKLIDKAHAAMITCHDRLVKTGIDLASYTSQASAEDFEDLRQALGIQQWNIDSIGYGTRLAQILMQAHPDSIRSVIMDSVVSLSESIYAGQAVYTGKVLDWLFNSCVADEKCHAAYPDLKRDFYDDVAALDQNPAVVKAHDLASGSDYTITVDGARFIDQTAGILGQASANTMPLLPRMIDQVKNGKYDGELANYLGSISYYQPTSVGMQQVIYCQEDYLPLTAVAFKQSNTGAEAALIQYSDAVNALNSDTCKLWNSTTPSTGKAAGFPPAITSSIPTLIEQGNLSNTNPPDWGKSVAKGLQTSYYVEFPIAGTFLFFSENWSSCAAGIIDLFLDKPGTRPDTGCASAQITPTWITIK